MERVYLSKQALCYQLTKAATVVFITMASVLFSVVSQAEQHQSLLPSSPSLPSPLTLTVNVAFVELHSGPGVGYPVLSIVERGEQITVERKRTNWLKVIDKRNNAGWISQDQLVGLSYQDKAITENTVTEIDFQARGFEAGIMVGDFSGSNFYNLQLDYRLSDVFRAELSAGKALGKISDNDVYELMLISQPFPNWVVIPYLGIGGGLLKTTPHSILADAITRQDTLMSAAVGIKYHVARNFMLRAEYKYSLALTDREDNEEIQVWKLGFSVFF